MIKQAIAFIQMVSLALCSCSQSQDLEYDTNKDDYKKAVNCLLNKYGSIFFLNKEVSSISVYNADRETNEICEAVLKLLEKHSVNIIIYDRDSSITFFSKPSKELKSKQTILIYTGSREKLDAKLTSDVKLKTVKGDGWYELEKVISLAN
ncbi:MAG TPA: hypothetical protein VGQ04_21795 [Chitinophagaceae bacterium]|jgi:aspartokinase|nr:hypothetical protein [Chitinophagaceae bacterium]